MKNMKKDKGAKMEDMKISRGNVPLSNGNVDQTQKQANDSATPSTAFIQQEGITISNHLNKLMGLISVDESIPDDAAASRMMEIKRQIQSNQYTIDFNALSDKLINSGVLRA